MEDSISKKQKVGIISVLHFEVFLLYDRKYYRKYLDNAYMKVNRPQSIGRDENRSNNRMQNLLHTTLLANISHALYE